MSVITLDVIYQACDLLEVDTEQIYTDYRGAPGGEECVGIVVDNRADVYRVNAAVMAAALEALSIERGDDFHIPNEAADIMHELSDTRVDNMGRGTIVYWPRVQAEG
ncbi:hypothetical protein ABT332_13545 [Saccharomonospora azurea]|uniref:hypothetical protein n=1 Tax=Saccharomonospora azurea TaxID=40988 RepID=UPI00331E3CD0